MKAEPSDAGAGREAGGTSGPYTFLTLPNSVLDGDGVDTPTTSHAPAGLLTFKAQLVGPKGRISLKAVVDTGAQVTAVANWVQAALVTIGPGVDTSVDVPMVGSTSAEPSSHPWLTLPPSTYSFHIAGAAMPLHNVVVMPLPATIDVLIGLDWLTLHGALVDCPGRRLCFGHRYEYAEQDDARDVIRGTQLVMLAMSLQTISLQTSCMDEFAGVAPWKPAAAERISAAVDTAYAGGANWQLAVGPPAVVARTTRGDWAIEDVSTPLHSQMPLACFIQTMAGVALAPCWKTTLLYPFGSNRV